MEPGQIIEFSAHDGPLLGVIIGRAGKKLRVRAETGSDRRALPRDVSFALSSPRLTSLSEEAIRAALAQVQAQLDELAPQIVLQQAWEPGGPMLSAAQVAARLFGVEEELSALATLRALREDGVYFKQRRELWEPRPADVVAMLQAQQRAEEAAEAALAAFVTQLTHALTLPLTQRAEQVREFAHTHDAFREHLALLQDYAASEEHFARQDEAEALLDALEESPEIELHESGPLRAFALMVELGLWSRHENLWLRRHHLELVAPEALIEEAQRLGAQRWIPEPWRRDLSRVPCVTIDDASTRDIDDALSCVPRLEGGWEVGIHIADPSTFVEVDSPLDRAARERGTSLYLPIGTLPMFPRELSEGAMSLVEGEPRPAITTRLIVDRDMQVVEVEVFPSTIVVDQRMTYDEVDALLMRDPKQPLDVALHDLAAITSELYVQRQDEGAVSFDIPDARLVVQPHAPEEEPEVDIELSPPQSEARQLVAEAMIMASANMAKFCYRNRIPVIYRGQEAPDGELFDEEVMAMPEGLPRFFAMRRKMKPSSIAPYPEPHHGLGLDMYVQATSPIRRYADLICQRQVKAFLTEQPLPYSAEEMFELAADVERATREAIQIERATRQYWLYYVLGQRLEEPMPALVLDQRDGQSAFVYLTDVALRVKCATTRRHAPGDTITVAVTQADPRRELLRVVER